MAVPTKRTCDEKLATGRRKRRLCQSYASYYSAAARVNTCGLHKHPDSVEGSGPSWYDLPTEESAASATTATTQLEAWHAAHAKLQAEIAAMGPCLHDGAISDVHGMSDYEPGPAMAVCDLCLEPFREATADEISNFSERYYEAQHN